MSIVNKYQNIKDVLEKKMEDVFEREELELFNNKCKTIEHSYTMKKVVKTVVCDIHLPECAICISDIENPHDVCVFENCKHMFCLDC